LYGRSQLRRPLGFTGAATIGPDGTYHHSGDLSHRTTDEMKASCGGDGVEQVYGYIATDTGVLAVRVDSEGPLYVSVRRTCTDASSEVLCVAKNLNHDVSVTTGELVYIIVDSDTAASPATYTLSAKLLPVRSLGESCDPLREDDRCDAGLRCSMSVCVANSAPSISSAQALKTGRHGNDLYVSLSGSDAEGDAESSL